MCWSIGIHRCTFAAVISGWRGEADNRFMGGVWMSTRHPDSGYVLPQIKCSALHLTTGGQSYQGIPVFGFLF